MKKRREKPASGTRAENGEKNVGIFRLRGAVDSVVEGSVLNTRAVKLSPKGIFRAGPSRSGEKLMTVDVAGDDLIEVEFDGGERLWINGEDFQKQFGKSVGREVTPDGAVTLVPSGLQLLPSGMEARGPINWVVKGLKVFGVDLAGKTAIDIAKTVEGRTSAKRPAPGLYSCSLKTGDFRLAPVVGEQPETKEAFLVFIHGTMSSTWGSFGDLWSEERSRELADLNQAYGDRVLAFEHAYLTKSPIENARDLTRELARVLPERAKVHLVTHSRGGLVGELLCRGGAKSPFSEEELNLFDQNGEYKESAKLLSELNEELLKRRFQVERFVRVACPALGTTLASQRLDRWLSVIGTVGSAALPNTPLGDAFADIGDFIAAVVQERTDPRTLPGLEAMMPESAFIKLVNWAEAMVPGDLTVIAGDIDPDKWWARLMVWLTDRFYAGDHDLVVNTPSMYGGVKRLGKSLAAFHKGPDVCHFNYFQNRESATQLVQALKGDTKDFEPLERPTVDIAREIVSRLEGPMPVLFVLPGIMGSELSVKGKEIWADIPKLLLGGFADLDIGAKKVEPTNVMARYYGALIKRLATTHKVVPFPYDWRLPVEKEAERLAAKVRSELDEAKRNRQPVRILAHSMGGLVARTMIALNDPLWKDICTHDGARLVMLGTPNGGSHAITELLVGQSSMMRNIALLDIAHSQKELLRHASRFPGVLAMLPKDSGEDYFSPSTWMAYHRQAGDGWVLPTDDDLKKAGEFRALLDNGAVDPRRMIYVAGCADVTLAGMHLDENAEDPDERIKFTATTRGDGRVTWDSGIPKDIPTWYMDAEHGDLPAHEEAFDAIEELLTRGTTTLLPQTPPVSRATVTVTFPRPRAADELYPDRDCLIANALGARPRKYRRSVSRKLPVRVSVAHGNLAFASHPVATGHYAGDTIISAEYYLDRELSGALTRRHQLGIYPGAVETNAVFINPKLFIKKDVGLKGAIVVGLGPVGGLSAASLTRSFARALLEYVTEWRERGPCSEGNEAGQKEFNVTSLLIGTGAAGISVNDSIFALLHGVARANQALANSRQDARISEVEFIELWEDRAIQAVKALQRLQAEPRFRTAFVCDTTLRALEGGLRRVEYAEPEGWWDRLQILGGGKHGEPAGGTLRFSALTQRARSEVRLLATQRELVDSFIEQSVLTTQDNRTAARTLFELLLPNEIKDQAPDQDNLIMVVDEDAARYPWELMEDPAHNSGVPFVIEHGLLRQLESTEFRETVREVTDKTALVIGDPVSKYVELRGAQAEARAVWKLLQSGKFTAEQRMRPTADQVMNALYSRPWRILHLAGHGIYNYLRDDLLQCEECKQPMPPAEEGKRRSKLRPVTGMIIGDTAVLSPQEVHQMRHVPELVFINCCHLGKIESTSGDKELNDRRDFNRIAANVATEFIRMGVRAVVAAGWAVDDAAATVFATTFYGAMLRGDGFGDAVRQARAEVYKQHPGTNTWGAYQCYGDPDYRLVRLDDSTVKNEVKPSYVAVTQAVTDIENVAAELSAMADGDVGAKIKRLEKIKEVLAEKRWLDEGGVSVAFARAYGKAKEFDSAIEYYKKSLGAEDGSMTLKDIEQLANLEVRWAVQKWEDKDGNPRSILTTIDGAIRRLEELLKNFSPTAERYSLLGSAFKHRARVDVKDRGISLKKMSDAYEEGYALSLRSGSLNPYPLLNKLAGDLAIAWHKGKAPSKAEVDQLRKVLDEARPKVLQLSAVKKDFWHAVYPVDLELLSVLLSGAPSETRMNELADSYNELKKLSNPRDFESVVDQFDYLIEMAEKNTKVSNALVRLKKKVEKSS